MRLTRQHRGPEGPQLNMASMIDIVFLLLVFFMCTATFRLLERDLPTQLPEVGVGQKPEQQDFDPVRVRLSRGATGVLVECDGLACATFADLVARLEAKRRIADVPVIIEGQGTVAFGHMVAALDACYQADLHRVAFSARGLRR